MATSHGSPPKIKELQADLKEDPMGGSHGG